MGALAMLAGLSRAPFAAAKPLREALAPNTTAGQEAPTPSDRFAEELQRCARGGSSLDSVRIETQWLASPGGSSAIVFGRGVGIWNRSMQFRLRRSDVAGILRVLREGGFASMPDHFGEAEGAGRQDAPRLKGRLSLRIGSMEKTVIQLVDGEQSKELATLAERTLAVCRGPAEKGVAAANLAEGLRMLASRRLEPEVFELTLQRRPRPGSGRTARLLRLEGRRVTSRAMPEGKVPPPARELDLSESAFASVLELLSANEAASLPINLFASEYTDLSVRVLDRSRLTTARQFLGTTPETHGEKQRAFDRIVGELARLEDEVQARGKPSPAVERIRAPEGVEKKEEEREKEKKVRVVPAAPPTTSSPGAR
jgi:hypothetical protein